MQKNTNIKYESMVEKQKSIIFFISKTLAHYFEKIK